MRCKVRNYLSATSVSGVYTPSRFHKEGSRSLRRDAKIHQKTFGTSGRKSGCVSRRHAARTGRRGRRTPPDHRFGPWAARRPAARPLGPPTKNGRPTGHASAAAPRRIDGAARRAAGRAAGGRRAALPRRVGAQRLAGADLRPPAPELRAPLPRVPRRPFPRLRSASICSRMLRRPSLVKAHERLGREATSRRRVPAQEAQMGRNRKCDTGHDVSWRWAWFSCRVPFPRLRDL